MKKTARGFTLIELLVVVSIIAILASIGIAVYSSSQKGVRDGRRRADIQAISSALENHYLTTGATCPGQSSASNGGTYCPLQDGFFANGVIPSDPNGGNITTYCITSNNTGAAIANPSPWTNDCTVNSGWVTPSQAAVQPALNATTWKVCANLETTSQVFCLSNQQQ